MRLHRLLRYPRTLGLLMLLLIAPFITQSRLPDEIDRAWVPHPINVVPLPDPLYRDGPFSGAWPGDLQYYDGRWLMGDGRGGIWHSRDGMLWQRASLVEHGRPRRMQNAPVRSINRGDNGTYMAAYLGGGGLVWPRVQRALGMEARRSRVPRMASGGRYVPCPSPVASTSPRPTARVPGWPRAATAACWFPSTTAGAGRYARRGCLRH